MPDIRPSVCVAVDADPNCITTAPVMIDVVGGDHWHIEDGGVLTVHDEHDLDLTSFAPGHWSTVRMVQHHDPRDATIAALHAEVESLRHDLEQAENDNADLDMSRAAERRLRLHAERAAADVDAQTQAAYHDGVGAGRDELRAVVLDALRGNSMPRACGGVLGDVEQAMEARR